MGDKPLKLFRVCRADLSSQPPPAARFINRTNAAGLGLGIKATSTPDIIDDIFGRKLPIPAGYLTRFGPPGLHKNVLYASEKHTTTFFEFGYHMLKDKSNMGRSIWVALHELELVGTSKPLSVNSQQNSAQLLLPGSYSFAHAWILGLPLDSLDILSYPNVREGSQSGGTNYAIYEKASIAPTKTTSKLYRMIPASDESVQIQDMDGTMILNAKPIMR